MAFVSYICAEFKLDVALKHCFLFRLHHNRNTFVT